MLTKPSITLDLPPQVTRFGGTGVAPLHSGLAIAAAFTLSVTQTPPQISHWHDRIAIALHDKIPHAQFGPRAADSASPQPWLSALAETFHNQIPDDVWEQIPSDTSDNIDFEIYGR